YKTSATARREVETAYEAMTAEREEIEYREYLNEVGRRSFNTLSPPEQKKMFAAASAELQSGPHAGKYKRMPADKFAEHLRSLVEIKLSRKYAPSFDEWRKRRSRQS